MKNIENKYLDKYNGSIILGYKLMEILKKMFNKQIDLKN